MNEELEDKVDAYICPECPDQIQEKGGNCDICGMVLTFKQVDKSKLEKSINWKLAIVKKINQFSKQLSN